MLMMGLLSRFLGCSERWLYKSPTYEELFQIDCLESLDRSQDELCLIQTNVYFLVEWSESLNNKTFTTSNCTFMTISKLNVRELLRLKI